MTGLLMRPKHVQGIPMMVKSLGSNMLGQVSLARFRALLYDLVQFGAIWHESVRSRAFRPDLVRFGALKLKSTNGQKAQLPEDALRAITALSHSVFAMDLHMPTMLSLKTHIRFVTSLLPWVILVSFGGCIQPGQIDQGIVGQYQRALAKAGPQQRDDNDMALLQPQKTVLGPLKVVVDDETGRKRVMMSLETVIMRTLANSLDIRVVSYDPSVSYEGMVQAAAEFDYVLSGSWLYDRSDEETSSTLSSGEVRTRSYSVGLTKKLITGAQAQLAWSLTQTLSSSLFSSLSEEWDRRVVFDITQPLLRGAWPEFNLATLRVARLTYKTSMAQFRRQAEEVVTSTIATYWLLYQARTDRSIQQKLLDITVQTRDRIDKRRAIDATEVEYMQAEAAVETRRADLIRSQKVIVDVQDQLVRLMGDSELNLLSDCEIVPTTRPSEELVRLDEADQLLTALRHSPALAEARLAIQTTDVSVSVAKTETLPRLDFQFSTTAQGLGPDSSEARGSLHGGGYVGYSLGLEFEYPIGNRNRIANWRAQKLTKLKAVTAMQNTADLVAQEVRERVREVATAHQEMKAQRAAVAASRNQLNALEATEELRRLSPEFLQVKLSAQETLALAARKEIAAIVGYNNALADLAKATGTTLVTHRVQIAMPPVINRQEAD